MLSKRDFACSWESVYRLGFRSRENRIDNRLSRQDRIDVLCFWGLVREQDGCFLDFGMRVGTGRDVSRLNEVRILLHD